MKTYIILILTFVNYNFCYSQKLDNDIEHLKKNVIGTWVSTRIDTTGYYSSQYFTQKHTFTSKKYTVTIFCKDSKPRKKTMSYSFKKTYIEELKKDIITIVFPNAYKLTSYEYIVCEDKQLKDYYPINWENITLKNDTLTFGFDTNNPYEYHILVKEKKTNR